MSRTLTVYSCSVMLLMAAALPAAADETQPEIRIAQPRIELRLYEDGPRVVTPPETLGDFDVELVLDDGTSEGETGVNGVNANQFLWLSQFAPAGQAFELTEIQVLFPPGDNMSVGNAVQLVVYSDTDGDPTNGATLLTALDETIPVVDGTTFSRFTLDPAVPFEADQDILIGVVPRFITSGTTSPTFPAAVDTTASQNQSWIALYTGDPPASPDLPSDGSMVLTNGNWMIRGFGNFQDLAPPTPVIEVPTLRESGLLALIGLLGLAGAWTLRRRIG